MKVYIDNHVIDVMWSFYEKSIQLHPALDYMTVINKIDRLEKAMLEFSAFADAFHKEPYLSRWRDAGYLEFVCEDFHFAYKIYHLPSGERVLRFHDAVHSLLNHNCAN